MPVTWGCLQVWHDTARRGSVKRVYLESTLSTYKPQSVYVHGLWNVYVRLADNCPMWMRSNALIRKDSPEVIDKSTICHCLVAQTYNKPLRVSLLKDVTSNPHHDPTEPIYNVDR